MTTSFASTGRHTGRETIGRATIPDPATAGGSDDDSYPAFEQMAAELETRIGFWLAAAGVAPAPASVQEA